MLRYSSCRVSFSPSDFARTSTRKAWPAALNEPHDWPGFIKVQLRDRSLLTLAQAYLTFIQGGGGGQAEKCWPQAWWRVRGVMKVSTPRSLPLVSRRAGLLLPPVTGTPCLASCAHRPAHPRARRPGPRLRRSGGCGPDDCAHELVRQRVEHGSETRFLLHRRLEKNNGDARRTGGRGGGICSARSQSSSASSASLCAQRIDTRPP